MISQDSKPPNGSEDGLVPDAADLLRGRNLLVGAANLDEEPYA